MSLWFSHLSLKRFSRFSCAASVINHPEVAILGIGRIAEKPVVKNGEIVAAPVLALSLSFDHRLIDGATAQKALNQIKRLLNDPQLLVMEA